MTAESPRYVDAGPMLLAGLDRNYTFQNMSEIPAQWNVFGPYIGNVPGQSGKVAYGLCHNMTDAGFDYLCGVEVAPGSALPAGFSAEQLPAQRYAVFPHRDHVSKLSETIDHIMHAWLPASGHKLVAEPFLFERYGESFDPQIGSGDVEVWLPIQA